MATPQQYQRLQHAMQAGVGADIQTAPGVPPFDVATARYLKHERVGINTAMSETSSLARLLIAKGLITEAEYLDAITEGMKLEIARYEALLSERLGKKVTLMPGFMDPAAGTTKL